MSMDKIASHLFPQFPSLPINDAWDLHNHCPRCFRDIDFVTEKNHNKKCKQKKLNHPNLGSKLCHCIFLLLCYPPAEYWGEKHHFFCNESPSDWQRNGNAH